MADATLTPVFKAELRAILAGLDVDCDADTFSQNYQVMWKGLGAALDEVDAKDAEIEAGKTLIDRLIREAQFWSGEARAHKGTVHEAYQAVSGATGEPGNWNGAVPIVNALRDLRDRADKAEVALAEVKATILATSFFRPGVFEQDLRLHPRYRALVNEGDMRTVYVNEGSWIMFEILRDQLRAEADAPTAPATQGVTPP
ncbi:hypothetical protein [Beijerinckia sp. L45]|uniref:hypothetical protein n=1 Tax=Beijerinckia sp. L45 TaxID=1641855 RepID=UPI00131E3FB7|nr:hypothetical protein [Beijerinckia sp. L45]